MQKEIRKFNQVKSERGSITVFVLTAMLFLLMVVLITYVGISNKKQAQIDQIDKIKEEYESSLKDIDNIYEQEEGKYKVDITVSENGGEYFVAKGGTADLTANISINPKENIKVVKREYGWSTSKEEEPNTYETFEGNQVTVNKNGLSEGEYYLWIKVTTQEGAEIIQVSEVFKVEEQEIIIRPSTEEVNKGPIQVTIDYQSAYVNNKNVGIGATLEEAKQNAVANENTNLEITENCYIYVTAEDAYGNRGESSYQINNIDNQKPIVTLSPNGGTFKTEEPTMTIDVTINVKDDQSGVEEVKYAWSDSNTEKPSAEEYQTVENGTTIPSPELGEGKHYLWVIATDKVGNVTEEPSFEYNVVPPAAPTVSLKENDATGAEYVSETWTNQDVYHEITLPEEGKVAKYQYSLDGRAWKDYIKDENENEEMVDYTTTFPILTSEAPVWMGDLTNNGEYYFVSDGNGAIKPTNGDNQELHSTTANSYIKLDLSEYTTNDKLNITINAQVSSESSDYGYAKITESTTAPSYSSSTGRIFRISGSKSAQDYSTTLTGGKVYYLHFGYYKDGSIDSYDDTFKINKITFSSDTMIKYANFYDCTLEGNKLTYTLKEDINREFYVKAIYEDGKSSGITKFKVQIDKTAPVINNYEVVMTSKTNGKLVISDVKEEGSGVAGYYISTSEEVPTKESNWEEVTEVPFEINNLIAGNTYYVWVIDKVGNISEVLQQEVTEANYKIDTNKYSVTLAQALALAKENSTIELLNDYTDSSTATIDKNIKLDTKQYTLTRTVTTTVKGTTDAPTTLDFYGKITNSGNIVTLTTSGEVNLKGTGTIENVTTSTSSSYRAISNSGTLTQDGSITVSGYYYGVYNTGTYTLNSGKVISNYNSSSSYAIYNYSSGDIININGGEVVGYSGIYNSSSSITNTNGGKVEGTNSYGISQSSGTVTVNDGEIIGKSTGIYISSSGTTNVIGGKVEGNYGIQTRSSSSTVNVIGGIVVGSTYGIYGYTTGTEGNEKITVGDINTEVNEKQPIVSGGQYGVYMRNSTYSYNFYNGVIMGTNAIPYTEIVKPREGYIVYTYYDYEGARKYCAVLTQSVEDITITQYPTEWTNQDVEVTIKYPSVEGATNQYSENGLDWIDIENANMKKVNVKENKTIFARMLDSQGILIDPGVVEYKVENIDKIAPEVVVTTEKTKYTILEENEKVDISYSISASDEGGSNLKEAKYAFSSGNEEPQEYQDITNGLQITENLGKGTYYLWLKVSDNAGNVSDITKMRFIVDLKEPVAQIGDTKYETIQDAFDAAGQTSSTVIILKDTDEVSTLAEGQTVILDLQGHTVGYSKDEAVITNNGTLTITDTSSEKTGTIENLVGTGIENNGILAIGDNSNAIEDAVPTIKGNKVGIQNNNTLNYYDGTIIGKSAISGEVQSTPENYGPVGVYENGMTIVNLRIVSDYVARIEWFYYPTLQSAFDACPAKENNIDKTMVYILKDISLDTGVNVEYGQNIILNLNGHILTSKMESVIKNYGELEIYDSSVNNSGKINSSVNGTKSKKYSLIINEEVLTISGGRIDILDKSYNYAIYNDDGEFNFTGGNINVTNIQGDVQTIYNDNNGIVNILGGIISVNSTSGYYDNIYGIYNDDNGTVNLLNGEINISSKGYSYGGLNNKTGTINIDGVTISVNGNVSYGICNVEDGIINMRNGSIECSINSSNSTYGILNQSNGKINIYGGTIYVNGYYARTYAVNNQKGLINIYGGTISSEGYSIKNSGGIINILSAIIEDSITNNSGTINIDGGEIYNTIINYSGGMVNITGGTLEYEGNVLDNSGKANIINGRIIGNVYNKTSGVLALGVNDGNINDEEINPRIIGGVNNFDGIFGFYDGSIQGLESDITTNFTKIEECYELAEEIIGENIKLYLTPKKEESVIENTITKKQYNSIQEAINEVTENENELKVLKDINITNEFSVPEGVKVIIDLNGKNITNKYFSITNYGNLEIFDNIDGKIINKKTVILNKGQGTIKFKNINIDIDLTLIEREVYGICNYNAGSIIMEETNLNIQKNEEDFYQLHGVLNKSNGTINIENGEINIEAYKIIYGINNQGSGVVNLNGDILITSINAGALTKGINNEENGVINFLGGNINVYSNKQSATGIYNKENGTINMLGGEINAKTRDDTTYGIINSGEGNVNVKNGIIRCNVIVGGSSKIVSGIRNSSTGTIQMEGGTIEVVVGGTSAEKTYAIQNYSTGTVILGIKGDGIVSQEIPNIKSSGGKSSYGIYNLNGKLYLYDGRLEGGTLAVYTGSNITEREENTEFKYENADKVLTLSAKAMDVAKIGDTTYSNLQEAIDSAGNIPTTIELLRGIQYTTQDTGIEIAQNQDIVLDVKGYSIISATENTTIINNGKLKIKDSSENEKGKINSTNSKVIENKEGAILELEKVEISTINNNYNAIYNFSTLNIISSTISKTNEYNYTIYNDEQGIINIEESEILGGQKGIYNIGDVNIINSTIEKGIKNDLNGTLKIDGGNFTDSIQNHNNAKIEMLGGTIYSNNYGIENSSRNSVIIEDCTITVYPTNDNEVAYGIYSSAGIIQIGVKDGNINNDTPAIQGEKIGIYISANSNLNFYDGIIKGSYGAISGNINELEEKSEIVVEKSDSIKYESITLKKVEKLAQVGTIQYNSIEEAISNISDTGTVTILRNGTEANTVTIPSNKNITIDLNGYELKAYNKLQNNGTLTITDNSEGAVGILSSYKDSPIYNNGTLTIENGNISGNTYGIYNQSGTATIAGGNIANNTYGLYSKGGTINVTGGNIQDNQYGTFTYGGTISISQGNFSGNEYGVYNSSGRTNITGITLNGNTNNIYNGGSGTINIPSGNIITADSTVIENASSGTIVIGEEGGTPSKESPLIQAEEYAIKNTGNGTIKFYDGIIKGRTGALQGLYLYKETGYTVKTDYIDGYYCDTLTPSGTVTTVAKIGNVEYSNLQSAINACTSQEETTIQLVNSISTDSAFQMEEGQNIVIDLNGKTITTSTAQTLINNAGTLKIIDTSSLQVGKITNETYNAIENTGTLTLGVDDGTVSTTCPEITGKAKAIINTGTLNFYDGIIKGATALEGTAVSGKPSGYIMVKTREETTGYEVITLSL